MPNASNTDRITGALGEVATAGDGDVVIADVTATRAVLAVQGPNARARLARRCTRTARRWSASA